MRNDLLAAIVEQSGGKVTDQNNRNLLLNDWLEAVKSTPVVNYIARLDGVSRDWGLSGNVLVPAGYTVRIKIKGVTEVEFIQEIIFGRDDPDSQRTRLFLDSTESRPTFLKFKGGISSATLDGSTTSFDGDFPLDGLEHLIEFTPSSDFYISRLGSHDNGSTYFLEGAVYDLEVVNQTGTTTLYLPLTNKEQGATQQPITGSVTATMANYSEDVWEVDNTVTNYVARTDGVGQYWQLSDPVVISSSDDFTLRYKFLTESLNLYLLGNASSSNEDRVAIYNDGTSIIGGGFSGSIPMISTDVYSEMLISRVGGLLKLTIDGQEIKTVSGNTTASEYSRLGGRYDGSTSVPHLKGYITDFEFSRNGNVENAISLTNKEQGATQQPTIGTITATMPNYSSDVWEEV